MYNNKSFCQEISIDRSRPPFVTYNTQYTVNIIKNIDIAWSKTLISMQINAAADDVFNFSCKSNTPKR